MAKRKAFRDAKIESEKVYMHGIWRMSRGKNPSMGL